MARHVVVHIGDAHIGPGPRLADKLSALDQIIAWVDEAAARGELAAIVWPGDLFHAKSTIDDRNVLAPRLQRLAQRAPVVLIDGNHDAPGELEILSRLSTYYPIVVVSQPKVVDLTGATGADLAIACLPYPHRAGLVTEGVAHADLGQAARQALDPVFAVFARELEIAAGAGAIPLFIGHVNVGGSVACAGQPQIGREIELDPALLARLGGVYKGLNHIHLHQALHGAVYAGSICRMDFGENETKGFVVATYDDAVVGPQIEGALPAGRWSWVFEPLAVPAQHLVEGRLTRDGFAFELVNGLEVYESPDEEGLFVDGKILDVSFWRGSDVKVSYAYAKAETSALDVAHIHAAFAGCRSLKMDPVAELEHSVRAPEIAAAVTLQAKVEAYCQRRQIPWTPALGAKLDALQQQPGDALLAGVRAQVDAAAPAADRQVA